MYAGGGTPKYHPPFAVPLRGQTYLNGKGPELEREAWKCVRGRAKYHALLCL